MNLPNKLTVFRIFLIPVFMLIIIFGGNASVQAAGSTVVWSRVIAAIVFAVASATDWFDGHIARSRNMVTNFGKFADPLADKMLTMTAFIFLVIGDFFHIGTILLYLALIFTIYSGYDYFHQSWGVFKGSM